MSAVLDSRTVKSAYPRLSSGSATKSPVKARGRIRVGESVTVEGRAGRWRVLSIVRGSARLVNPHAMCRSEIAGIAVANLKRVTS